jgi:hypothetical protein
MTGTNGCPHFNTKHGHNRVHHRSPEYRVWAHMLERCRNPNCRDYADWGGRGITVCARWQKFENFLADMGERPDGTSIDRKNNDLGYSKDNCRGATRTQQNNNQRIRKRNTSGARGVTWYRQTKKWAATIYRDGKNRHLGYFSDIASASVAYEQARSELNRERGE